MRTPTGSHLLKTTRLLTAGLLPLLVAGCLKEKLPRPEFTPTPETPAQTPDITEESSASPTDMPETPGYTPTPTPGTPTPTPVPTPTPAPPPTPEPDLDGDGWSIHEGDCGPEDDTIYPGALEIPFDGIDSDCDGYQDQILPWVGLRLGDGGPATEARLDFYGTGYPAMVVATDGTIYLSLGQQCRIRQIKDGIITTVVGTGICGKPEGEGTLGTQTQREESPDSLALDDVRDHLYYADNDRIRRLDLKTGTVITIAGTGEEGAPVEGQIATEAPLRTVVGLEIDVLNQFLYFIQDIGGYESGGASFWRINLRDGYLHRILNSATSCRTPKFDVSAQNAQLCVPDTLTLHPITGEIYFTAYWPETGILAGATYLARIDSDGNIRFVAGVQLPHDDACGTPLDQNTDPSTAAFCNIHDVEFGPDGTIRLANLCELTEIAADLGSMSTRPLTDECKDVWPLTQGEDWVYIDQIWSLEILADSDQVFYLDESTRVSTTDLVTLGDSEVVAGQPQFKYAGDEQPAETAILQQLVGLARWDDPNSDREILYFANQRYDVIYTLEDGIVRRFLGKAGVTTPLVYEPVPLAVATLFGTITAEFSVTTDGQFFFEGGNCIRRVKDGLVEVVAGGGSADIVDGQYVVGRNLAALIHAVESRGEAVYVVGADHQIFRVALEGEDEGIARAFTGKDVDPAQEPRYGEPAIDQAVPMDAMVYHNGDLYGAIGKDIVRIHHGNLELVYKAPDGDYFHSYGIIISPQGDPIVWDRESIWRVRDNEMELLAGTFNYYTIGYSVDSGVSSEVVFGEILGVVLDENGDLLITELWSGVVRRLVL